jgi:hypothetical protein
MSWQEKSPVPFRFQTFAPRLFLYPARAFLEAERRSIRRLGRNSDKSVPKYIY